jgi:hypothetical protein
VAACDVTIGWSVSGLLLYCQLVRKTPKNIFTKIRQMIKAYDMMTKSYGGNIHFVMNQNNIVSKGLYG